MWGESCGAYVVLVFLYRSFFACGADVVYMFLYRTGCFCLRPCSFGCWHCCGFGLVLAVLVLGRQLAWWKRCGCVEAGVGSHESDIAVCGEVMDGQ